jgi:hypothetical protein
MACSYEYRMPEEERQKRKDDARVKRAQEKLKSRMQVEGEIFSVTLPDGTTQEFDMARYFR